MEIVECIIYQRDCFGSMRSWWDGEGGDFNLHTMLFTQYEGNEADHNTE